MIGASKQELRSDLDSSQESLVIKGSGRDRATSFPPSINKTDKKKTTVNFNFSETAKTP